MAGTSVIGALRVTLGLDSAAFETGLDRANRNLKKSSKEFQLAGISMSKAGAGVKEALGGLGLVTAITVGSLAAAARAGLDYAGSLGEISQSLGVSTQLLQEFRYAATQNGASVESADNALGKFSVTLGKAFNGNKEAAASFKKLGLNLNELAKASDSERYQKVADAIAKTKDPTQRAAAAVAIFGKGARDIIPTLEQGADGFRRQAAEAREYGLVLSDSQIQNADKTADKIDALTRALNAKIAGTVADNAHAISVLVNSLADLVSWSLKAISAYNRWNAMMGATSTEKPGYFSPTRQASIKELAGSAEGRNDLRAHIDARLARTARDRKEGKFTTSVTGYGIYGDVRQRRDATAADKASQAREREHLLKARANLDKLDARDRQSATPAYQPGDATVTPSSGGGGGGKNRGGKGAGRSVAEIAERFDDELRRAQNDVLSALQGLTSDYLEQARLEREKLENDRLAAVAQVQGNKDYSEAQKVALIAQIDRRAAIEADAINRQENVKVAADELRLSQASIANQQDLLQQELGSVRTVAERRRIELKLLDLQYQRERAELDAIIASKESTEAEKDIARARLAILGRLQAGDTAAVNKKEAGPVQQYLDTFPKTAAEMNEALEGIAANGLKSLNDGITDAIVNGKSLGDVFGSVANQIIADLVRIAVQQAIIKPLANALFGGSGGESGGGGGGIFGSLFGAVFKGIPFGGGTGKIPGFATGGSFKVGGVGGIDKNLVQFRATRGEIVDIRRPGNDNRGGGGNTYHFSGNLMTPEFWAQIQAGDDAAASRGQNGALTTLRRARQRSF